MPGHSFRPAAALTLVLLTSATGVVRAHDVPGDVTLQAFLRPEGNFLRFLVRVPLQAMRDVDIPRRGPGYLDLARAEPALRHAATIWLAQEIALYEEDTRLPPPRLAAVRVSLPSDPSFRDYDSALAHLRAPPLDPATELYWEQGVLDAVLEYPIASPSSRFAVRGDFRRLGLAVTVALRLVTPDGTTRAFELHGDQGLVRLDPRWHQAALAFTWSGFRHVLDGLDHLLFLLCVVIPVRRIGRLVLVVSSFTAAHSVTLLASAYGLAPDALWFPPLVEAAIAGSIVYMAFENIVAAARGGDSAARAVDRRWIVTGLFGLVHGFGFSFALREQLQFAGAHLLTSLLAFNVGVELAQLVVIGAGCAVLALAFRTFVDERLGAILLSALVAHTGWHWTTERVERLGRFPLSSVAAAPLATVVGWLMVVVAAAALVWVGRSWAARRAAVRRVTPPSGGPARVTRYGFGERA